MLSKVIFQIQPIKKSKLFQIASWTEEDNWLVPSPNLIAKVINKFVSDRVKAILIIPDENRLHSGRCCMMVKILKVL